MIYFRNFQLPFRTFLDLSSNTYIPVRYQPMLAGYRSADSHVHIWRADRSPDFVT